MFTPRNGTPQWRTIYDAIRIMKIDQVITYEAIEALLPEAADGSWRGAFLSAVKFLEANDHRTFVNVRGTGYRMAHATEHMKLAKRKRTSARRQMKAAVSKIASADRSQLSPEQRRSFDQMEHHLRAQQDMLNRLKERQDKIEERQGFTEKVTSVNTDRIDRLEDQLRKAGLLAD